MSHSIHKDSDGTFYCTKCGTQSEDSPKQLCKAALHEEEYKRNLQTEKMKTQKLFYLVAILVQIGIFVLIFKGFDSIAQSLEAVQKFKLLRCNGGCIAV